jgi:SusD family.
MYSYCVPLNFDTRSTGSDGTRMAGGSFASAITDEGQSFHIQPNYKVQNYYVGNVSADQCASWSSTNKGEDDYLRKWKTIRKAYVLLENVDKTPDATTAQKERIKAESKLMIATVYFEMFKRYGGVPILKGSFTGSESQEDINLPRASLEETYNFIINLLDDVIKNYDGILPANYTDQQDEFGRFPMALAYALKARVMLYAASPLYNTDSPYSNELGQNSNLICFMKYDKERWKKAADAATDAINYCLNNGYAVVDDPTQRENAMNYTVANINYPAKGNTEVIWGIPQSTGGNNWGMYLMVRTFSGTASGYACNLVPINQIERWEIDDDKTPGQYKNWDAQQSFVTSVSPSETNATKAKLLVAAAARKAYEEPKLDPRFYASVIYNGDNNYGKWSSTGEVDMADAYLDNGTIISSLNGTLSEAKYRTTILHYVRKFHRGFEGNESAMRPLNIYFRMAELYLIRAEALNEYESSPSKQVHDDLNFIRTRSGMCNVKSNADQSEMREIIAHERNIEMYYEDQRWFDLRRTLKSAEKIPVQIYKIQIRKWYHTSSDKWPYKITYDKVPYQKRYWSNSWYMNPFPKSEINKFYGLIQNPGW